jgi:hypothetical protein
MHDTVRDAFVPIAKVAGISYTIDKQFSNKELGERKGPNLQVPTFIYPNLLVLILI